MHMLEVAIEIYAAIKEGGVRGPRPFNNFHKKKIKQEQYYAKHQEFGCHCQKIYLHREDVNPESSREIKPTYPYYYFVDYMSLFDC
ncbi:hypothetical protein RIR_jg2197.t1 [Rhizophagus irregularis DAOM 181602=DAOM 197198]|nr:hypothetical protein RIR_jg2197.t1 [Rhizophagus irregularis DAOM 181602=DAOM 197198]